MTVALHGNLRDFGMGEVFQLIGQQRKTGVLEVRGQQGDVELRFDAGGVVAAAPIAERRDAPLVDMIARCGLVPRDRLAELERDAAPDAPIAARIAAAGLLDADALREIEDLLTRETIFDLLRWDDGSFRFVAQPIEHARPAEHLLGAEQVLMDGLRMVDEWHAFAGEMPDEQTVFRRRGSLEEYRQSTAGRLAVAPAVAERVLMLVDGRANVRRVVDLSRLGSFEAMRALVQLARSGWIEPIRSRRAGETPASRSAARSRTPQPRRDLRAVRAARGARCDRVAARRARAGSARAARAVAGHGPHPGRSAALALAAPRPSPRDGALGDRSRHAPRVGRRRGPRVDAFGTRCLPCRETPRRHRPARPRSLTIARSLETSLADQKPLPTASPPDASTRQTLVFDDNQMAAELYGEAERTLRILEQELGIEAHARGNEVRLVGAPGAVAAARKVLEELYGWLRDGHPVHARDVTSAVRIAAGRPEVALAEIYEDVLGDVGARRRVIAKNLSQRRYVELIRNHDLVFALGPAGTGKTYLAMACAIAALNRREVSRVILTRPAVEAGERLGFLPGTLAEKVNPYLRPLYDALHDMMAFDKAERLVERGVIEVAPLAFMRGRTLNDSFVILDEAQNTTSEQMKMFLTRLGFDSRAVVTGDTTQIDLPTDKPSGLVEAARILEGVEGIGFQRFTDADVVRHPLVQAIIRAYERAQSPPPEAQ